jgi:hypothetical protein
MKAVWTGLAAALALAPGVAHAAWHVASAKHFVVYSDDDPEKIREFAGDLERFDKAVRVLRGLPDPPIGPENRLTVFVVRDLNAVAKLAGTSQIAGFYEGRATGAYAVVPKRGTGSSRRDISANAVLLHEYTHHLMFSNWPDAAFPIWFSEGFAEFHSTAAFDDDGSISIGNPALHRGWELVAAEDTSLADLLSGKLTDRDAIYGRGWLITHLISFDKARQAQFGEYVRKLNAGEPPAEAAAAFGDVKTFERDLTRYSRQRRMNVWSVAASALPVSPVAMRPLTAGEAATMAVRIRSTVGVTDKTAKGVAEDARRAAAPFPDDPGAQGVLAEAEVDAGQNDAAIAAADRALKADPRNVQALLIKSKALVAKAAAAKVKDPAVWTAARAPLLAANRIDTESPAPMVLYYLSFRAADQAPSKNAGDGLLKAQQLAPFDPMLRLTAARLLVERKEAEWAKRLLKPMVYSPHGQAMGTLAAQMIGALDRGDYAGALAAGRDKEADAKTPPEGKEQPIAPAAGGAWRWPTGRR